MSSSNGGTCRRNAQKSPGLSDGDVKWVVVESG